MRGRPTRRWLDRVSSEMKEEGGEEGLREDGWIE